VKKTASKPALAAGKKPWMLNERCMECSASIWNAWRQKGINIRHQARRHDLPDTSRRMLEALIDLTFGLGLSEVLVPNLKYFSALTGMEKPHAHEALHRLHLARIIRIHTDSSGRPKYSINEDHDTWKVAQRELMLEADERIQQIRALNGLPAKGPSSFFDGNPAASQKKPAVTEQVKRDVTKPVILPEEMFPDLF
jgi:hypothetical protein